MINRTTAFLFILAVIGWAAFTSQLIAHQHRALDVEAWAAIAYENGYDDAKWGGIPNEAKKFNKDFSVKCVMHAYNGSFHYPKEGE